MPSDAEFMSFTANAGTATLSVQVAPSSRSNLNMRLTMFDSNLARITAASRSGLTIPQVRCAEVSAAECSMDVLEGMIEAVQRSPADPIS
jgi:hypothetical protein